MRHIACSFVFFCFIGYASAQSGTPTFIDITQPPYSAVANGDATSAIQSAINAAAAAGGGVIIVPRGTFFISATLNVPPGVSVVGAGGAGQCSAYVCNGDVFPSVLQSNIANGAPMLSFAVPWADRLENLTLDAGGHSATILDLGHSPRGGSFRNLLLRQTASGGAGIYMAQGSGVSYPPSLNHFERVYVIEMASKAMVLLGATLNTFVDVSLASLYDDTLVITNASDDNMFFGGMISASAGHTGVVLNYPGSPAGGFLNNFYGTAISVDAGATGVSAAHNAGLSFFYESYLSCCGTAYAMNAGAMVKFVDVQLPGSGNGYAAPLSIPVGGSPATYTNMQPYALQVAVYGGAVSLVEFGRGNAFLPVGGATQVVTLQPGDHLRVTFSSRPMLYGIPQ